MQHLHATTPAFVKKTITIPSVYTVIEKGMFHSDNLTVQRSNPRCADN